VRRDQWGLLIGGLLGALFGVLAAYLYLKARRERGGDARPSPAALVQSAVTLVTLLRQIVELAEGKGRRA
jgi:membrane associated rhomboid family serine protease